jgi:hypothetical protein
MIDTIRSMRSLVSPSPILSDLTALQQTTQEVFTQIKEVLSQNVNNLQQTVDSSPLREPWIFLEGGFWAGFWGLSALFSGMSLYKLYENLTLEHPAAEKFSKIGLAVKTAFVDLISLGGTTAYNIRWAHDVKILPLGQYAPLVKGLSYGSSLIVNILEFGWSMYNIHTEKEAILKEASPVEKEKQKQRLCLALIKVVGNISMIVWSTLGIGTIAAGLTLGPMLLSVFLAAGFAFSLVAYFYQRHIENASELCPIPKLRFLTVS